MQNLLMVMQNLLLAEQIEGDYAFLNGIIDALEGLMNPLLILVGTAGSLYAVYLGVIMAKAEDQGKRDEAKKKVINAVLALVVIVILILLLKLFVANFDTLTDGK